MTAARPWSIPGYAADQLVGDGPLGEVWTGRALGADVAVTLECAPPVPPSTLDALRAWVRSAVRHPHLMPSRDVIGEPDRTVVVRDRAAGGSLATVLAHRGRLRPGEVVTVLVPVAAALDHLHERAVVHGAVVPERVLFDIDGRPALAGAFVDRVLGAAAPDRLPAALRDPAVAGGQEPGAATDVFMLASCGLLALDHPADEAPGLLDALAAGADPDPARRPTAAGFAAAVARSCPAEPVRLLTPDLLEEPSGWEPSIPPEWRTAVPAVVPDEPASPVEPPAEAGEHRRPRRTGTRRVALALAALLLVVAGALWFRSPSAAPGPIAEAPPAQDRWTSVIDGLDAVRATAYERGDVALLGKVWAPGDRLRADAAQLRALVATGCTARGVRHRFDRVTVLDVGRTRVRLRVTQWLPASERVRRGEVIGAFAASTPSTVTVDLVADGSGWRLS